MGGFILKEMAMAGFIAFEKTPSRKKMGARGSVRAAFWIFDGGARPNNGSSDGASRSQSLVAGHVLADEGDVGGGRLGLVDDST